MAGKVGAEFVDAHLAETPEPQRSTLKKLRAAIRAAMPDAEEGIAWRMPSFRYKGVGLVCYEGFKNHCSFFPMSSAVMKALAADLAKYETDKGTIRFPVDKPLPATLVKKIVKARIAEQDAGKKRRAKA